MKILIACEESQTVCKAFREKGHEAYSCDILPCSGGHPEWHIQGDVLNVIKPHPTGNGYGYRPYINFITMDGTYVVLGEKWDMIIAHPPCTDLAVSGARHFARKRADGSQKKSIEFFMEFTKLNCTKIAIENPVCIMSSIYKKPDQIIQPYMFGDPFKKTTCLWLKGLPKLIPTKVVEVSDYKEYVCKSGKIARFSNWINKGGKSRKINRSKTFQGIANAMADQWG